MRRPLVLVGVLAVPVLAVALVVAFGGCGPGPGRVTDAGDPDDAGPAGPDLFADVTAASGVAAVYRNGEDIDPPHLSILESLGGGVAVLDYDKDGQFDLYFPGGGEFGGADRRAIVGLPGRLYRNLGGLKFQDVTAAAGLGSLAGGAPWFYSHAAAVGDYDRDGWPDLLVSGWGRVALFRNVPAAGGGRAFADVSAAAGLDRGVTWATSAAFADLDGDGFADLYVCQYVDWSWANNPPCQYVQGTPDVCPPKKFNGLTHLLYRNTGKGTFVEVGKAAGVVPGGEGVSKGLGVLAADLTGDGKPEVYVANDTVPNFLYLNRSKPGAITLAEKGLASGTALDEGSQQNGSMGVDAGDPEGTGRPAVWVTNYEGELHALYRNITTAADRPSFLHVTRATGLGAAGRKFVGWGTGFADLDHDGWEDLVIADGHAIRFPATADRRQRPVLFRNTGDRPADAGGRERERFVDVSRRGGSYFAGQHLARGAVLVDLDNDGRQDWVVSHVNDPAAVLRNVAPAGHHWVGVCLEGKGHADVVGAKVTLGSNGRTQTRFARGGGSYASSPDRRLVFGLGPTAAVVKLTVTWPDGSTQEFADVPVDGYVVVTQGEEAVRRAYPKG